MIFRKFSRIPLIMAAFMTVIVFSCKEVEPVQDPDPQEQEEPEEPSEPQEPADTVVVDPEPIIEPLKKVDSVKVEFNTGIMNQMSLTEEDGVYTVTTSGGDPYVYMKALTADLLPEQFILSFEYTASADISVFQIFYGNNITEGRSVKRSFGASSTWKSYAYDMSTDIERYDWGHAGENFRLDFGVVPGVTVKLRNICIRGLNEKEYEEHRQAIEEQKKLEAYEANLRNYLDESYPATIKSVSVSGTQITIAGAAPSENGYYLVEVSPYEDLLKIEKFGGEREPVIGNFVKRFSRIVEKDGYKYDRLLSRWVVIKSVSENQDKIISHARYADYIQCDGNAAEPEMKSKKGLGGYIHSSLQQTDLNELGINSVTVNLVLTSYVSKSSTTYSHSYAGKTYYFNKSQVTSFDKRFKYLQDKGIVVSAILLLKPENEFRHPGYISGPYTMPNMTTAEAVNSYAAALDFLSSRYNGEKGFGLISNWIMHNEVDCGLEWTNMGNCSEIVYVDTYMKSCRMCYLIARQHNPHAKVLGSFTHSWTASCSSNGHTTRSMLNTIVKYSKAEGDFEWGVAAHPYPQDLGNPCLWSNDFYATYSMDSPFVTFKNLEVIDKWIKAPDNLYNGTKKRVLWLSENGTCSPTYSDRDLANQAAGAAWALKKIARLDGIDGIQWHNWKDNPEEGINIGLRNTSSAAKPVWYVYKAWLTPNEDSEFNQYLPVIGISSWEEIHKNL